MSVTITRSADTDDDGSGTVGTVHNNAWKTTIYDEIDTALAAVGVQTELSTSVTGTQNNYAPALNGHTTEFWSGASDATFTGLAGGVAGQRYTFKNTGTSVAYFAHQSGSSLAGNKFRNTVTSGNTPVAAGGSATWEYDGTDWQLIAHEQGAWITPTFAAGNFTVSGGGSWTVDSGDVTTYAWRLSGNTLFLKVKLITTTIAGTVNFVNVAIPNGFTLAKSGETISRVINNGGTPAPGAAIYAASGTVIGCYSSVSTTAWTAGTNNAQLSFDTALEVN